MQKPILGHGLCECGCGQATNLAIQNRKDRPGRRGHIKGEPMPFAMGHSTGIGPVAFWANVHRGTGCWIWTGKRDANGYGRFGNRLAHRLIVAAPKGLCVLHRCDNPPCVNPAHLLVGTQGENVVDMYQKNRRINKLTEADVRQIRLLCEAGQVHRVVAERFGVSRPMVSYIARGVAWRGRASEPPERAPADPAD